MTAVAAQTTDTTGVSVDPAHTMRALTLVADRKIELIDAVAQCFIRLGGQISGT